MTLHQLIGELSHRSAVIAQMNLANTLPDGPLASDLRYLLQTTGELDRVARSIEGLVSMANFSLRDAEVSVRSLLAPHNFYGQFCELAAYDWLLRHDALFTAQVPVGSADCLNPNGITIDGLFANRDVYFDVKAMGFQTYVMEQFRRRLQSQLPQFVIQIDGSLDISVKDIEQYAFRQLGQIGQALNGGGAHAIPQLNWSVRAEPQRRVHTAVLTMNPYALAEENRAYPFKTASQFTRNRPFMMVFAYNAVINQNLFLNFSGSTDITLRSLARRAFLQFASDQTSLRNHDSKAAQAATVGDASSLLSALLFIDFSSDEARLYLNPIAGHRISQHHIQEIFDFAPPLSMLVDDFEHDIY